MVLESIIFGIIAILAVFTDAYGDAINDKTNKRVHWAEIAPIGLLISSIILIYLFPNFYSLSLNLIIFYCLIRFGFFSIIYNKVRGDLPIGYIGKTSIYDKFLNWIFSEIISGINIIRNKFNKELIDSNSTKIQYVKDCISVTFSMISLFFGIIILFAVRFDFMF